LVNGIPCVAYVDRQSNELRLALFTDPFGRGWNEPLVLATSSDLLSFPALVDRMGRPLVFYREKADGHLKAAVPPGPAPPAVPPPHVETWYH
jgi:hypothetical protein